MNDRNLVCLVDSGATNNFISRNHVDDLGLEIFSCENI